MPETPDYAKPDPNNETLQESFERAQAARLAGDPDDLDEAEIVYLARIESEDPYQRGIGHHYFAICQQNRAWDATGEQRDAYFDAALQHADNAFAEYEAAGRYVEASDSMVVKSSVYRDQDRVGDAEETIVASIAYLQSHRGSVDDKFFYDSHFVLKHAKLAALQLRLNKLEEAEKTIENTLEMGQSNEYFQMITDQIAGDVYRAKGSPPDRQDALGFYTSALERAHQFGEKRRVSELEEQIALLN